MRQHWGNLSRRGFMGIVGAAAWSLGGGGLLAGYEADATLGAPLFAGRQLEALRERAGEGIRYIHMDCGISPEGHAPEEQLFAGLIGLAVLSPDTTLGRVSVLGRRNESGIPAHLTARLVYPSHTAMLTLGQGRPGLVVRTMEGAAHRVEAAADPEPLRDDASSRLASRLFAAILEASPPPSASRV
ncbi:MAG: hypothetical protein ACLFV4_13070 [Candidatus Hydrogenedentota bacterium]